MVRRATKARRADDGTELLRSDELNPWMTAKLMSCCEVRQDDDQRKSIVQQNMQQSTFFLRRVIEGQGGIALSYVGLIATDIRAEIPSGGS